MTKLSKKQFDALVLLEQKYAPRVQRDIAASLGKSLGAANVVLSELRAASLIDDGAKLTKEGRAALKQYKVKRAVIIAAGFGTRLVPITLNTPKPLVRVHGKRIIDSLLDALVAADINEIYIVRGYIAEEFDALRYKYPNVKFIENPIYNEANNISSVLAAANHLQNAYLCEADLLLQKPSLISKYQYCSNYLAFPVEKTDDWCFKLRNGFISKISIGGKKCWQMVGISYWNDEDGKKLGRHVKEAFEMPGGKELYWDRVALEFHLKEYKVAIRECKKDDIIEIDTFNELKKLDAAYRT